MTPGTRKLRHASSARTRRPLWHVLLLSLALASVVVLFSQEATHFNPTIKYAQTYPRGQAEKPTVLGHLTPDVGPRTAFTVSYFVLSALPAQTRFTLPSSFKPPSRAPPTPSANV